MQQVLSPVLDLRSVAEGIFVLTMHAPEIAARIRPGQFVNIRIGEGADPLLRRPFSVSRTEGDHIEILFNVVGKGTALMSRLREGALLDLLGPLGTPFATDDDQCTTALLLAGGLGVAPMPILTERLRDKGRKIMTFLGARAAAHLVTSHLDDVHIATDDGSRGFKGTVVDLAATVLRQAPVQGGKIFACGPMPMLRAAARLSEQLNLLCEVSLEGPMACGIGICQGCPVELVGPEKKYALMCKDGPTFDARTIRW